MCKLAAWAILFCIPGKLIDKNYKIKWKKLACNWTHLAALFYPEFPNDNIMNSSCNTFPVIMLTIFIKFDLNFKFTDNLQNIYSIPNWIPKGTWILFSWIKNELINKNNRKSRFYTYLIMKDINSISSLINVEAWTHLNITKWGDR